MQHGTGLGILLELISGAQEGRTCIMGGQHHSYQYVDSQCCQQAPNSTALGLLVSCS